MIISLLQTFLSSRAVYVVVFNLSHDLEKPIPVSGAGAVSKTHFQTRVLSVTIEKGPTEGVTTTCSRT